MPQPTYATFITALAAVKQTKTIKYKKMRKICLNFQIHQPFRLKRYRFFNIGEDHYYYDDYANESYVRKMADLSYLPANKILLDLIKANKNRFKVSFSISGTALDQFELYTPEVLESFKKLADTGCVEFLGGTDAQSLAALANRKEFENQVTQHREKIKKFFGREVGDVFCNTSMLYSNDIAGYIEEMGFHGVLTEGARHILGWKSPNYVYCSATNPRVKLLLRNYKLSDDIRFNFSSTSWSEYPLTVEKFLYWMNACDEKEDLFNISLDYTTFGDKQPASSGIFDFLRYLPVYALKQGFSFVNPSEMVSAAPIAPVSVRFPISWMDEERDTSAWLGNELQQEAFHQLYDLAERVALTDSKRIRADWKYLQACDHLRFMSTKHYATGRRTPYNPYDSPYDAFINYMNVLSDFTTRLQKIEKKEEQSISVGELEKALQEKDRQYAKIKLELDKLRVSVAKARKAFAAIEEIEEPVAKKKTSRAKKADK